jgi:hypothetical protein
MKPFVLFSIISLCALTVSAEPTLKSKISPSSGVEYKGKVALGDLRFERSKYLGCVIMVRFEYAYLSSASSATPYILAYDASGSETSFRSERILYDEKDQDATKWAVDCARRGSSTFSVYVLVNDRDLMALGERRKKDGNGYAYRWRYPTGCILRRDTYYSWRCAALSPLADVSVASIVGNA